MSTCFEYVFEGKSSKSKQIRLIDHYDWFMRARTDLHWLRSIMSFYSDQRDADAGKFRINPLHVLLESNRPSYPDMSLESKEY